MVVDDELGGVAGSGRTVGRPQVDRGAGGRVGCSRTRGGGADSEKDHFDLLQFKFTEDDIVL